MFSVHKHPGKVEKAAYDQPRLITTKLGVWDLVQEVEPWFRLPGSKCLATFNELYNSLPYMMRFFNDLCSLGPWLLLVYVLSHIWTSLENTITLYYSSRLIDVIQARIQGQDVNGWAILSAIFARVLCSFFSTAVSYTASRDKAILRDRVKFYFMEKSIDSALKFDIPTTQDPDVSCKLSDPWSFDYPGQAWANVECLMSKLSGALDIISQAAFLLSVMRQQSAGPGFLLICVAQPLLSFFADSEIWKTSYVYFSANPYYRQMKALYNLACDRRFQRDNLSNGMGDYIKNEFHNARMNLGDTCTDAMASQWRSERPVLGRFIAGIGLELPIIFFAIRSFYHPANLSPGSIAILQQTALSIRYSILNVLYDSSSIAALLTSIKSIYALSEIQNKIQDGIGSYPLSDKRHEKGMEIEFRNVTFAYPGTYRNAVNNMSFKIKAGQLAVIVGINGSGKSSLVKLFNRLYDPSEGHILIDGRPLPSYRLADIRNSMAILCQDHQPYPLTLSDNIAMGLPNRLVTKDDINRACEDGGAQHFIRRLPEGLDTILDPVRTAVGNFVDGNHKALREVLEKREISTAISGGESQRLAASRTFLRMSGGDVKFLAVDEPTSALDPEGEFQLFRRLREDRKGKTVVFITHRFGHLTKHADVILCLKDGCLVEQGTHEELIAKGGEYYKLHDIQARAFTMD